MKLGVCYYPEQWPSSWWETDAKLMVDAGISLVRMGEFAWSRMEPSPNNYQWDWLDEAIEILSNHQLSIILCTPTAALRPGSSSNIQKYCQLIRMGKGDDLVPGGTTAQITLTTGFTRRILQLKWQANMGMTFVLSPGKSTMSLPVICHAAIVLFVSRPFNPGWRKNTKT